MSLSLLLIILITISSVSAENLDNANVSVDSNLNGDSISSSDSSGPNSVRISDSINSVGISDSLSSSSIADSIDSLNAQKSSSGSSDNLFENEDDLLSSELSSNSVSGNQNNQEYNIRSENSGISNSNNGNNIQFADEISQDLAERILNANDRDIILIEPGYYKIHGINITKNITLLGNANPREITIDGEELSTIFFIQNCDLTVKFYNITIINGKTDNFGGGICIETGNVYVDNCIFINNTALNNTNGGAISNYGNETNRSYLFINNSLFLGNHADHDGGAVTTCYARSDIYNSLFMNNSAVRDGGAIRVSVFGYGQVCNCTFMYNHADEWAGAYYSWAGNSSIDRCIFMNNTAGTNGGAIMVSGSLNLTNSVIVNNTGGETGGSFYIQQPMFDAVTKINIHGNLIANNTAPLGQEMYVKWNATDLLFLNYSRNDFGGENPLDSSVIDPDNITNRPPTVPRILYSLDIDLALLDLYSDVLDDYYGRNDQENSTEVNHNDSDRNQSGLRFDTKNNNENNDNKLNDNANGHSNLFNNSNSNMNNVPSNNTVLNTNSTGSLLKNENSTLNYVSKDSKTHKMVELINDDPVSIKSLDLRYVIVLSIVLITFLIGLFKRRKRE